MCVDGWPTSASRAGIECECVRWFLPTSRLQNFHTSTQARNARRRPHDESASRLTACIGTTYQIVQLHFMEGSSSYAVGSTSRVRMWDARTDIPANSLLEQRRAWSGGGGPSAAETSHQQPGQQQAGEEAAGRRSNRRTPLSGPGSLPHAHVHDEESLAQQVRDLKKDLSKAQAENRLLKVTKERTEQLLRKAEDEQTSYKGSGAVTDGNGFRPDARLLKQLKQKVRELQAELQKKDEQLVAEGDEDDIRMQELEITNRVYFEEVRRLKEVNRLLAASKEEALAQQEKVHAHAIDVKEEQLETLRGERTKMRSENAALDEELGRWMDENERLRQQVLAIEGQANAPPASTGGGGAGGGTGGGAGGGAGSDVSPKEVAALRAKLKEMNEKFTHCKRAKERVEADKVAIWQEMSEVVQVRA